MRRIQFYFDEDATQTRLVKALRSRGITVFTVTDTGKAAASDEEQLTAATTNECVLYTFNVADF